MTDLPEGWALANIPDMVTSDGLFSDGDWVESKDQDPDGDVRLIQLADVGDGAYRDRSARFLTSAKAQELGCTFLRTGDVLIARMPDPLGRACLFPGDSKASVTVVDVCVVRPGSGGISPSWLMYTLNAQQSRRAMVPFEMGTTRKRISRKNLARIPLPVPPRSEQERIVAAIEEQFSQLDSGAAALERVRQNLKRMRAAVLERPFERIPADQWVPLISVGDIVTGRTPDTKASENYGGDLPFVTPSDFDHGDRVASAPRALTERGKSRARSLPEGAVLATCIGATLGKIALADAPCATNQQINAVCPNQDVLPAYLFYCLSRPSFTRAMWRAASSTTMPIINKSRFSRLSVPVVPAKDQGAIVAEIEEGLQGVDHLVRGLQTAFGRAGSLRSTILATAFSGRLVQQDPTNEAASVLLERIAAERASSNGYETTTIRKPRTNRPKVHA